MCTQPNLAPSPAYKHYGCRCTRCVAWKREAATRTNNKERARQRSKEWRQKNPERSRQGVKTWTTNNPDKVLAMKVRKYGLSLKQFRALGALCMICGKGPSGAQHGVRRLCVDHDHATNRVRGLLCGNCNVALGHFHHSIRLLHKAVQYLKENGDVYDSAILIE